jgi:hypothetical protein
LRGLAAAEVAKRPGSVPKHAQLAAVTKQGQEGPKSTGLKDEVAACRAVSCNVSKSPDSLFAHIGLMAAKELNKDWHSTSLDDDLGLLGGSGSDVGEGPGSFELHQSMWRPEELNEAAYDASFNYSLDRGVALFGKEFPELGRSLNLLVDLVGKYTLHHLGKLLVELYIASVRRPINTAHCPSQGARTRSGTYLALDVTTLIIAVWGCAQRRTGLITASDATALGQVLFTFGSTDLDLLLFAAATELVRLEGGLRLEGVAAMLWDILLRHGSSTGA